MNLSRRGFLLGSSALAVAAVVPTRVSAIVPMQGSVNDPIFELLNARMRACYMTMHRNMAESLYGDTPAAGRLPHRPLSNFEQTGPVETSRIGARTSSTGAFDVKLKLG